MLRDLPAHLSTTQTAAWLEQLFFVGKPIFTIGQRVTIPGPLRPDIFEAALRATVAESPGLRLTLDAPPAPLDLQDHDLRGAEDPDATAAAWMQAALAAPFDLHDPALYRFALLRVADDRIIWFQAYHHIIMDAVGMARLTARAAARYRAMRFGIPLPELRAATPGDLAAAEAAYAATPAYAKDRGYWLERLNPLPPPLVEKDRHSSARGRSGIAELRDIILPRPAMDRFTAQAKALGATTAGAFLAVTYCAFARLYGRSDMVIGTSLARSQQSRRRRADRRAHAAHGLPARTRPRTAGQRDLARRRAAPAVRLPAPALPDPRPRRRPRIAAPGTDLALRCPGELPAGPLRLRLRGRIGGDGEPDRRLRHALDGDAGRHGRRP
ncbi:condensation domain-containing protein [Dankookia sp. P2]|uniref:condensation domain-containing protein n=1 Tax=Dankookia sp. P2 TaxID=3423955 RepID=UPI003D66D527